MDRASNSSVISFKILLCIVVFISLFLWFVPYVVTLTIIVILSGVLVYFDSSCASDLCTLLASWFVLSYSHISSYFLNAVGNPKRIAHPNGMTNFRPPPFKMNYVKIPQNPIARELNLNPSTRSSPRSRNSHSSLGKAGLDYCVNLRDDKVAGPSHSPQRGNKPPKNSILTDVSSILTDVTSNYAHQHNLRHPSQFRNEGGRDSYVASPGSVSPLNACNQLYDNIASPGFSSRVAQFVSELNATDHPKNQNVGNFPLVHFHADSKKKLTPNTSQIAAKQRVTVRIAPPTNRSLKKTYNVEQEEKMKSVLEVLKEMSRKRMYSAIEPEEAESRKRLKIHSPSEVPISSRLPIHSNHIIPMNITPLGKRIRDSSSDSIDDEVEKKRRQVSTINNEIRSSLSSSLTITPPHLSRSSSTKRKATNDITSADKHFKVSATLDLSSESSAEKSSSSAGDESQKEGESFRTDSSTASNTSRNYTRNSTANLDSETTQELSHDKTSGSTFIIKKTSKVPEDNVDSNSSHKETGVLRLIPVKKPIITTQEKTEQQPKKDILRVPKDWEANPRSLQKTPKNPGKMLKKILCAIEGTDDVNFDSLPDHVRKLIASVDDIDGPGETSKTTSQSKSKESETNAQNQTQLLSSTSISSSTFSPPVVSTSLKFPVSTTKTISPNLSLSATSQSTSNPLLAPQR